METIFFLFWRLLRSFAALGSGLYAVFCPALIKKYRDAATFFESEKVFLSHSDSLAHLFVRIEKVKGRPAADPLNLKALLADNSGLSIDQVNYLAGPISEHYYLENRLNAPARLGTIIAYFVAAMFFAIPTLITVYQVAQLAFRQILA